jgi:hypothetical protein
MPKFTLTTIERWEHKVDYCDVEADSLEDAFRIIADERQTPYDHHEVLDDGDEVLCLWQAQDADGNELPVPPALAKERKPRVLVEVTGGVAEISSEGDVETLLVDYDNDDELPEDWQGIGMAAE